MDQVKCILLLAYVHFSMKKSRSWKKRAQKLLWQSSLVPLLRLTEATGWKYNARKEVNIPSIDNIYSRSYHFKWFTREEETLKGNYESESWEESCTNDRQGEYQWSLGGELAIFLEIVSCYNACSVQFRRLFISFFRKILICLLHSTW